MSTMIDQEQFGMTISDTMDLDSLLEAVESPADAALEALDCGGCGGCGGCGC